MGDIFLFDFELSNHIEEINEFNQKKIIHKNLCICQMIYLMKIQNDL